MCPCHWKVHLLMSETRSLDDKSLEANRHGQLSPSQRTFVYRVGIRWVMSAMFGTSSGLLLVFAVGNIWFTIMGCLVILPAATYLVLRSLDCIVDSSHNRVALVSGGATPETIGMIAFPFDGWREEGWERATVGRIGFWMPPGAIAMSVDGEISVYFAPRSRVVVNVELAASDPVKDGESKALVTAHESVPQ